MIPKLIHYCWFGRGKMPELAQICINSWKKYLPDYELMLWNEDNFDIDSNTFTKEAYQSRKFAFVTDYVRLFALQKFGGIYMDTDVEVTRNLDRFLKLPAFSGFEDEKNIPTGLMASASNGTWVTNLISYYDNQNFILPDGSLNTITNTKIIGDMSRSMGFVPNNNFQILNEEVHIFPKDYFCPKSQISGQIILTENTFCIHHFSGSWMPANRRKMTHFKQRLMRIFGVNNVQKIITILKIDKLKNKLS